MNTEQIKQSAREDFEKEFSPDLVLNNPENLTWVSDNKYQLKGLLEMRNALTIGFIDNLISTTAQSVLQDAIETVKDFKHHSTSVSPNGCYPNIDAIVKSLQAKKDSLTSEK